MAVLAPTKKHTPATRLEMFAGIVKSTVNACIELVRLNVGSPVVGTALYVDQAEPSPFVSIPFSHTDESGVSRRVALTLWRTRAHSRVARLGTTIWGAAVATRSVYVFRPCPTSRS